MTVGTLTDEQLLAELTHLKTEKPEPIASGWRSREEWARIWKLSSGYTYRLLSEGAKAGLWEIKKFRSRTLVTGKVYLMPHYRKKP